ncbi:MAG: two-component system, OmpR family, phosphate regulon sensor histidine kinase PhoR [Patescibacteria group bacterium]|nr:two-component system, OmpR family, phosphate regulon sensor histidine kinase PhoR [Patescibacteria group bacterium]
MYNKHKMYKGGPIYTPKLVQTIRWLSLLVIIILMIYGILIQTNIVTVSHRIDNLGLFVLSFWGTCISLIQIFIPNTTKLDSALRLIAYHILAGAYLIFISGVGSPFITCWLPLILASYVYFSERGLRLSTFSLIIIVFVDIFLWNNTSYITIIYDLIALAVILVIEIIALTISRSQEVTRKELNKSKIQESLQRDRTLTIVNNLTDAVLSVDMKGIIQVYNAASLNLLDTNESLNGNHIDDILPLTDQDNKSISLFKELKKLKTVIKRDDVNYKFDNDEQIRLEITCSPIRSSFSRSKKSETHDGYIIIMRDITKAKSLEEERDEFISVVSHELRTPITIAEGTISNVQVMMSHPDITNAMLLDSVNTAHDQIMFLANMVNDLSALSRAERGVADKTEDIDIKEMAHKLTQKYNDEAKAKNLHLDLDLSPKLGTIRASRLYLEELLQNFITNSIKYTKEGSVKIIIENKNGVIKFAIKDTGIGISKTDQSKIFNKFYRSEDYRTRETGGTGLGLYVATKLAHKLGTKIQLTSRLNFGSTFSFTLPESTDK